ncbi:MAG: hypothetical protein R3C03_14105 [Pirellulaceae bacterium]
MRFSTNQIRNVICVMLNGGFDWVRTYAPSQRLSLLCRVVLKPSCDGPSCDGPSFDGSAMEMRSKDAPEHRESTGVQTDSVSSIADQVLSGRVDCDFVIADTVADRNAKGNALKALLNTVLNEMQTMSERTIGILRETATNLSTAWGIATQYQKRIPQYRLQTQQLS